MPAGAIVPATAFAREQEDDNIASSIVYEVLDNSGNAEDEANQEDTTNTGAEDSNQGQDVDQDNISTLGDDAEDFDDVNVAYHSPYQLMCKMKK